MANPQDLPPWPEHGFTKRMYSEWLDDIWQWLRDHRVVGVNGGFITDAPGGGLLIHPSGSIAGGDTPAGPWSPVVGKMDDTPHKKKVAIEQFSTLMGDAADAGGTVSIEGHEDEFSMDAGSVMYLEMDYLSSGALDRVTLKGGTIWEDYPSTVHQTGDGSLDNPFVLTKTQFLVAYGMSNLTIPGEPPPALPPGIDVGDTRVVRCVFTPLFLEVVFREGYVFEYPVAWNLASGVRAP